MTHMGTVTLETDRLILRRFTAEDDSAMFANWASDSDVTKYLMWKTHESIEESRQVLSDIWLSHYDEPDFYQWAIVPKDLNEPIGSIGVVKHDDQTKMVHIGYCIGKDWWRKGYTSEALIRLVRFFFEDVGMNRIESRHDPRNPNSGKVMQKAGLRYEGTSLESDWNNQGFCDAANYALLAKDYFQKPQPYEIREVDDALRRKIQPILDETWGAPFLAVNGKLRDSRTMQGYAAVSEDSIAGYLLYEFHDEVCEIMVLESVAQNIGIATALIEQVKHMAKTNGVSKIIVQTSNDNTHAFRFYQRRGFTIREMRLGAIDTARQLKPSIPFIGEEGIPLRDEIEFEIEV